MLEELGCRLAAEAGDVEEAAKLVQSTDFDLAILDVNLKGKLITPVAELMRARELPIILRQDMARRGCRSTAPLLKTLSRESNFDSSINFFDCADGSSIKRR